MDNKSAVERVMLMEKCFDGLRQGVESVPPTLDMGLYKRLISYYTGGGWLKDFELDEAGGFPSDLKRGVLSEDGVFNLLAQIDSVFYKHT